MYLSCLLIDVGEDPDRPRPGRLWLRNRYRVHQRFCMAFPSELRRFDDKDFLNPFKPEDFVAKQVHVPRATDAGFLFRIDPQPGGRVVGLVQSGGKPDWDYAFHNADYLLVAPPEVKQFDPCFEMDQHLRFRLVANPTRKIDTKSRPDGHRRNGKRVPVPSDQLDEWLACRAGPAGFSIEEDFTTVQSAYIYVNKTRNGNGQRLRSVRYDGVLKIIDPNRFQETLVKGIGPGKAFGFGLLSVAPVSPHSR
jgi:CRISPR system Cascade subunit CasE